MATTYPSPWHAHAAQRLSAGPVAPLVPPVRMEWTPQSGYGPGAEILGAMLRNRRVLELGCGPGHNAAHLAHHGAAWTTGIDLVGLQVRRARSHYGYLPRLSFTAGHALHYLQAAQVRFDVIYSVFGAIGLVAPELLLPAVAARLTDHGRLVFTVPHPRRQGRSPGAGTHPYQDLLTLPDRSRLPIVRWELSSDVWASHLRRAGFTQISSQTVSHPKRSLWPTTLLITARKT